ncbi:hypothetical protein IRJ41_018535, partial [Triplophysa rosa]
FAKQRGLLQFSSSAPLLRDPRDTTDVHFGEPVYQPRTVPLEQSRCELEYRFTDGRTGVCSLEVLKSHLDTGFKRLFARFVMLKFVCSGYDTLKAVDLVKGHFS